ncbi:MAG TPA: helix-turn-helix domain-containing protein [Firmicutes bacterium]|nr:helix-turn-helix domain-containing protein [Bacillota bacterium]
MRVSIGKQIADLRRVTGTTQKQLAWAIGVDEDAIRQWEAGRQNPTLAALAQTADYFHVSIDFLLTGESGENARPSTEDKTANPADPRPVISQELPDDGRLRVVQFLGSQIVSRDDFDPAKPIPLCTESLQRAHGIGEKLQIEIWGSAQIAGGINGSVTAGGDIACGHVAGSVKSGKNANCGNISGGVVVNGNLNCGRIAGPVICRGKLAEEK